jgi:Tfp pilus assembly protein PilO
MKDSLNNKVFFIVVIFVNILLFGLLILEINEYNKNSSYESKIKAIDAELKKVEESTNYSNLDKTTQDYNNFSLNFNAENRLQDFLSFLNNSTSKNNLELLEVSFPISNQEESISRIKLKGSFKDIRNFISDVENDLSIKEILNYTININVGVPVVDLEIKNYRF